MIKRKTMNHGSLFSGIGGFDLAAEWMGWNNVFHCEWNPFGRKVLNNYWPNSISYEDITKTDFSIHRGNIDIITGGFPCQPYSMAGKRLGKDDERHLWPEMLRAIREISPRWVVGENVFGLVNWNGGMVFDEVQADLEAQGYEVQPFVLPACAVNAPHRRDRVWFVAYRNGTGLQTEGAEQQAAGIEQYRELDETTPDTEGESSERMRPKQRKSCESEQGEFGGINSENVGYRNAPDTNGNGQYQRNCQHEKHTSEGREYAFGNAEQVHFEQSTIEHSNSIGQEWGVHSKQSKTTIRKQFSEQNARSSKSTYWQNFPTQSPICCGDDGLSYQLDGITFPKWRNESIKAYGNAIVPQVVYQIFKAISIFEQNA